MIPFLKLVARDVYEKFNGRFDDVAVVFPNKRAGLFFNRYLLECSGNAPIWSPRYMTINELFLQNSELAIGDPILLVDRLYKQYVRPRREDESIEEYENSVETIDGFYYWGEMLIKDFDDIDKHLADAKQLFANIKDLRELGTAKSVLDKEQIKAIERFFKNFKPDEGTQLKENFKQLWERLFAIYTNFRESLRKEGIAYEGMLFRDVIEKSDDIVLEYDKYIFVGFNALNDVETGMFKIAKERGKALFYWDYDVHYVNNRQHEAGHFMRSNLERFPNELGKENYNNLATEKSVTVVQTNNDSTGVRYIDQWLNKNFTGNGVETAIVLCDETMLAPTLHAIPNEANGYRIEHMNVTMGFPLNNTPIFGLVKQLVDLQTRGWSAKHNAFMLTNVSNILKHPYIVQGSENCRKLRDMLIEKNVFFPSEEMLCADDFLKTIFCRTTDNREWLEGISRLIYAIAMNQHNREEGEQALYEKLFVEAIFKVYTQAKRLVKMIDTGELQMQQSTLGRLFVRMLSSQSLPFHGEPVVGLQVMGLLETRNLDFKNVILLGVNEGNLPRNSSDNSYVPYNLRRAFGLTLSEHRDSIYAYYFYRLLQRARSVTLVYNTSPDSKTRGECSRYILQLQGSGLYNINHLALSPRQGNSETEIAPIEKNSAIIEKLRERFDTLYNAGAGTMTPSAINKYIDCGLAFFYYYVMKFRPIEDVDDEFKENDLGVVFHKAAELLYEDIIEKQHCDIITSAPLLYYAEHPALLYRFIDEAFKCVFFKENKPVYNGEQYINRGVLHHFLLRLVKMDAKYAPFRYIGSESDVEMSCTLKCGAEEIGLRLGGTIDRIDCKVNSVNIVDYKTGGGDDIADVVTMNDIFEHKTKSCKYRLQAFLYSTVIDDLMQRKCGENGLSVKLKDCAATAVSPQLLYVHHRDNSLREEFVINMDNKPVEDIKVIKDDFLVRLKALLQEMFDVSKPFEPAKDTSTCKYCDYKEICNRKENNIY